jgi:hypothetical protein
MIYLSQKDLVQPSVIQFLAASLEGTPYCSKSETKSLPLCTVTNFYYHGTFVSKRAFGKRISVNSLSGIA